MPIHADTSADFRSCSLNFQDSHTNPIKVSFSKLTKIAIIYHGYYSPEKCFTISLIAANLLIAICFLRLCNSLTQDQAALIF